MAFINLKETIPPFVNEKQNIIRLILYTSLFALFFLNFYAPFGLTFWFSISRLQYFLYSSLIILTGVVVVVISRILMYRVNKRKPITYGAYFIWVGAEIFSMALFYVLFEIIFLNDPRDFFDLLRNSVRNTALVLLLPYSVLWLYFSYIAQREKLQQVSNSSVLQNNRDDIFIPFYDEKGMLKVSIKLQHIIYLEANDNYVIIKHMHNDKLDQFILRNNLKNMEQYLKKYNLIRCHRSYAVNFAKVRMLYKTSAGLMLEFDTPGIQPVPISKHYAENIMKMFIEN